MRINPSNGRTHLLQATSFSLEAAHALREGHDPSAALKQGRQAVERALQHDAGCVDCRVEHARVELAAAAWEQRQGRSGSKHLQQALAAARRAVEMYPYRDAHEELARVCLRMAETAPAGQALTAVAVRLEGASGDTWKMRPRNSASPTM